MTTIDTGLLIGFNHFAEQMKQMRNRVTAEEWNHLWNVMATQADQNATILKQLKEFIAGNDVGVIELPEDYTSLFAYIEDRTKNAFIAYGPNPPEDAEEGTYWFDTN